jgi:hypothetical protein
VRFCVSLAFNRYYGHSPDLIQATEPSQSSSAPTPKTHLDAPAHKRIESDASSTYSQNRLSTFDAYKAYQKQADRSTSAASNDTFNFSSTDESRGTSVVMSVDPEERRPSQSSSHLAPAAPNGQDSRLSEFYDAYYRNSQVGPVQTVEAKRVVGRHSTIVEVDTPLASPMFPKPMQHQPGVAF